MEEAELDDFRVKKKPRFQQPTTTKEIDELAKGFIRANTKKNTGWDCHVFEEWKAERNTLSSEKCPDHLFENPDSHRLNYWLSRFVAEVRQKKMETHILHDQSI